MTFCTKNSGYAGVCTFVRRSLLPEKSYLSIQAIFHLVNFELDEKYDDELIQECDQEGRVLLLEYSNVFILNIYFPAGIETSRTQFRRKFYELVQDIVVLLKQKKKHLILLGDFNTTCGILDSAYMLNDAETNGFVESFRSMSEWLEFLLLSEKYGLRDGIKDRSGGVGLVDVYRVLHPTERTAYTCFSTQLGGRKNNFGTRIDYILCDESLRDAIQTCSILSTMTGSDHLPVTAGIFVNLVSI
ncbi:exodeoxyribonuclease [Blastocystis sp. subtype 4]|uniref:exodeoxyribonuclease n=1 Tax=Blastocystis sp. subtype 4 TaxID=944170 RepID=UPI0007121E6F|nr:exodeoxyribonuclease [Blastocystis sp. subtype 4]KNB41935.1 exodeoxyribonuclease [Blastocystis sp. subtype 4]|eukprot:XP_014525378.1 exodeoxyribonuclease [Blastocystis sp. subtype 4]